MRDGAILYQHKLISQKNCGRFTIFHSHIDKSLITISRSRSRCKSYTCPNCRRINYLRLRRRVLANFTKANYTFWTLSKKKPESLTPQFLHDFLIEWRSFFNHLRKFYPKLKFIRILEISQSGQPHFHVLFNQYVDFHTVNRLWKHYTGGCHTQFERIDSHRVAYYITKYVTKASQSDISHEDIIFIAGIRRFEASKFLLMKVSKHTLLSSFNRYNIELSSVSFYNFIQSIVTSFDLDPSIVKQQDNNTYILELQS
jgi:hypothetical protein